MDIKSFLQGFKNKRIVFVPNPGNAGDAVIAWSTIQMFREYNIQFDIYDFKEAVFKNKIIMFGGGGSLHKGYQFAKEFLLNNHKQNELIILPQTISGHSDLLSQIGDNVTIFTRELVSFEYTKTYHRNVYIAHDMAFALHGIEMYRNNNNTDKICNAFRCDDEKTNMVIPSDNYDVTRELSTGFRNVTELKACNESNKVISYLSNFNTVNTNRLHVAIVSALLGLNVNLYSNSYYKNKAVYDHSIKHKFNNVKWIE